MIEKTDDAPTFPLKITVSGMPSSEDNFRALMNLVDAQYRTLLEEKGRIEKQADGSITLDGCICCIINSDTGELWNYYCVECTDPICFGGEPGCPA